MKGVARFGKNGNQFLEKILEKLNRIGKRIPTYLKIRRSSGLRY